MIDAYSCYFFFFFNDTATTEIYTLSLHDALPISAVRAFSSATASTFFQSRATISAFGLCLRSEEHTSELQSLAYLVCRLLLEKKKKTNKMVDEDSVLTVAASALLCLVLITVLCWL